VNEALSFIRRQRKPKRRKVARRPRWIWPAAMFGAFCAAAGVWVGLRALLTAPVVSVHRIDVHGTARLSPDRVKRAVADAVGQPILLLDLDTLRARIEQVAVVRAAAIARHMPDLLQVRVVEREAVLKTTIGGAPLMLDATGAIFPAGRAQAGDEHLPVATGLETVLGAAQLIARDQAALRALTALKTAAPAVAAVTPATFDLSERDRVVLTLEGETPPLWLDREEPGRNLQQFFAWRERVTDLATGRPIDLRFPHRLTLVALEPPPETVPPEAVAEIHPPEPIPAPAARRTALTE
jgi:cell division septal protein FtsQ